MVIRVLVVDDHQLLLDGLVAVIATTDDIEVVATATSVSAGASAIADHDLDVVVADFDLPDGRGTEFAAADDPDAPHVLVITGHHATNVLDAALESGCAGFLSKGGGANQLTAAIRSVANGDAVFPVDFVRRSLGAKKADTDPGLTSREHEILSEMANAKTAGAIADDLHLSEHTVRNHIRNVLTKLHSRSQLEAVVTAARAGIVSIGHTNPAG